MTGCPACGKEIPPGGFIFCPWCASPLMSDSAAQRKTVSILFCDLVESTALGSHTDPEVLRGVLEQYWSRARAVVESHGGTVEKFIGDAVFGVFGIPSLHDDDALRAVRAAVDLVEAVHRLDADVLEPRGISLEVRVGVNTGEVVGGTGRDTLMSGDAGNVAARLQASAQPGEVLLGETTYRLLRDDVEVATVGPFAVKGKDEPLPAYRLVSVRPATAGPMRRRWASALLVGRERHLTLGEALFATVVEESCCAMLTVLGEPGVGKTRTVEELIARIGARGLVLTGRCLPYGDGIGYWPTVEMLRGIEVGIGRSWEDVVLALDHAADVRAGLDAMMGRPSASSATQTAWGFRKLIEALAAERPVVLAVDDVQWADPVLLDLLDHLTDLSRGVPILLIVMARPEFVSERPLWGTQRTHSVTITLPSLTDPECEELVRNLLGAGVGEEIAGRIVASADGIPLFVEEMAAMLVQDGHLVSDGGRGWVAASDLAAVDIPATVGLLVASRLDRLPKAQRDVVSAASVIGRTFYPEALRQLLDTAGDVAPVIDSLVRSDLIVPAPTDLPGHEAYAFTHIITADMAYRLLPKARRAELHQRFAQWWRAASPDSFGNEVIAWHLEQSALYRTELGEADVSVSDEAARILLHLANQDLRFEQGRSAIAYADRAVRLLPTPSRRGVEARLIRARAAELAGDLPEAVRWAAEAEVMASRSEDAGSAWRARLAVGHYGLSSDPSRRIEESLQLGRRAIDAVAALDDPAALVEAYQTVAWSCLGLGQAAAAAEAELESLKHARRARDRGDSVNAWTAPAVWGLWHADGTPDDMARVLAQVESWWGDDPAICHEIDDLRLFLRVVQDAGHELEVAFADRARVMLDQGSPGAAAHWMGNGVGLCREWRGDNEGAVDALAAAADLLGEAGETALQSTLLADQARLLASLGRRAEARTAMARTRAISAEDDLANPILLAATEGVLSARSGDAEESERWFSEAFRLCATTDWRYQKAQIWESRSLAREILGDRDGALASAREALQLWELKGFVPPRDRARARVAALQP